MRYHLTAFADEISPNLEEQLRVLKRLGLGGLDLRSVDGVNVLDLSDEQVAQVRDECLVAGVPAHAVGSPVNKVPLTADNRPKELAKLKRAIEVAETLEVKRIRIFTPEAPEGTDPWDEVYAWMLDMVAVAQDHDMILLHENDGRFYGAYPENAKRLFETFAGPNFRAAFDFANTVLLGYKPLDDWFPWILPYLDTIHIKDVRNGQVVPAGEGDGQIAETFRLLHEQKWEGTLTMEPHLSAAGAFGGFSGEQLFEAAVVALRKTLATVGDEA